MGGLVAMWSEAGQVDPGALERATRSLDHRGPDDRQCWIDAARSIGLGHTRLATLDLAGGRQPLVNEDGTIHAVVDGELYDSERLRDRLTARGHQLRTQSDSELLVHLYEEIGPSCVEHLRGEFAFILHDADADLLIAGRDRCGVKPLVYARRGGVLLVASEAKALFAAGVPATWDIDAFLASCIVGGPLEDETMFAGVQRIPAGHLLVARRGRTRLVRYWDLDYPVDGSLAPRSEVEDREALAEALSEAVRLRLRADVAVGCYLGGIDSCTMFGLARRHTTAALPAFTIAFGPTVTAENALAEELAARAGATYTSVPLRVSELVQNLDDVVYAAERPLSNLGCAVLFQLGRAVRDAGFKVVLTGEGSDEIFAGYAHFINDAALAQPGERVPASPGPRPGDAAVALRPAGRRASVRPILKALGACPTWIRGMAASVELLLGVLRPELADRLIRGEPLARLVAGLEVSRRLAGRRPVHRSMYLWAKSMLPGYILSASNDSIQMAHGVECRLPYLDHRLIELSTRLPIDRSIRGGVEKYLLREVARPLVGEAIYRRPKDRVIAPELVAIETTMLDQVHDLLRDPAFLATAFFEPARVVALLDALPAMAPTDRAAHNTALMLAVSVGLMQQRFGISNAV
jgi:asparagine synthase (glutamine-hydrolysing)